MSSSASEETVCITGATGYIAAFVVKLALEHGYKVRGTVRSLANEDKLRHLRELPGADERLELVEADLNDPSNFKTVLEGCKYLLHTATPIVIRPFEHEEDMYANQINPAVDGTKAIVEAAVEAGVEKVVLTSSVAAMMGHATPPAALDENTWSDEEFLKGALSASPMMPYFYAKTAQEKVFWETTKKHGIKAATICPHLVVGPALTPKLNDSNAMLLNVVAGKGSPFQESPEGTIPDGTLGMVDVREVAQAHVLAMEKDVANGRRYLLFSHNVHCQDIATVMRDADPAVAAKYPELPLETADKQRHNTQGMGFDVAPVRELGVEEISWQDSLTEAARMTVPYLADL